MSETSSSMRSFSVLHVAVKVKCVVETRDQEHCHELENLLRNNYAHVDFGPNVM